MRSVPVLVWCAVLLMTPRPASCAQGPRRRLDPPSGARIRFDAPSLGGRVTGTLVEWQVDTFTVNVDGYAPGLALIVAADSVNLLEVRGERRETLEGLGAGALAGTLLALAASPDVLDENGDCTTAECLAYQVSPHLDMRLAVLGGVGALLGAVVGSGSKVPTWTAVPLRRVTVGPTPGGGFALGVRLSF